MGNDVKNAGQSPEGQNPALNKEKTFGIRLRASRWNTIAAAAVLVLAAYLLFRKNKYDGERLTIRAVDAAGRKAVLK